MLTPVVFVPHVEGEYQRLVTVLDDLIDVVGEDKNHPLASLIEVIGVLIEKYEDEHVPELTEISLLDEGFIEEPTILRGDIR